MYVRNAALREIVIAHMHNAYIVRKFCGPFLECGGVRPNPPNPPSYVLGSGGTRTTL